MATAAQIDANRENAQFSTGPRTPESQQKSSANSLKFGIFSTKNCVRPEETEEYETMATGLWNQYHPMGAVEEMLVTEIIRAAWRLRRCAAVEAHLGLQFEFDPMLDEKAARIQASVDRARAQATASRRRDMAELNAIQTERWLQTATLPPDYDNSLNGLAGMKKMIDARLALAKLKKANQAPPEKPEPPYNAHTAICNCGSGKLFKQCHGYTQFHRP